MKALILAAGFGTRLKPFTLKHPKALVPVCHVPIIFYILAFLKKNKIKDVVINLHHQGHQIKKMLGNGNPLGLNITYSQEPIILGTGGGIRKALKYFDEDFLVINGDIILDFDLKKMIQDHKKRKSLATLALYNHKNKKKYGLLHYQRGRIVSILKKPKSKTQSAMFAGVHLVSRNEMKRALKNFKAQKKFCIMRDVYIPELARETGLTAFLINGFWSVCDSLEDVKFTEEALESIKLSYGSELKTISRQFSFRYSG